MERRSPHLRHQSALARPHASKAAPGHAAGVAARYLQLAPSGSNHSTTGLRFDTGNMLLADSVVCVVDAVPCRPFSALPLWSQQILLMLGNDVGRSNFW